MYLLDTSVVRVFFHKFIINFCYSTYGKRLETASYIVKNFAFPQVEFNRRSSWSVNQLRILLRGEILSHGERRAEGWGRVRCRERVTPRTLGPRHMVVAPALARRIPYGRERTRARRTLAAARPPPREHAPRFPYGSRSRRPFYTWWQPSPRRWSSRFPPCPPCLRYTVILVSAITWLWRLPRWRTSFDTHDRHDGGSQPTRMTTTSTTTRRPRCNNHTQ